MLPSFFSSSLMDLNASDDTNVIFFAKMKLFFEHVPGVI